MHMPGKVDIGEAMKVAALCLLPVTLSLIGLMTMGRKPQGPAVAARGKPAATGAAAKPTPRRPA